MTIDHENPLGLLWGAREIGKFIGKPPRATFRLLETGQLPGRKQGKLWTATKEGLRAALTGEKPAAKASDGR